MGTALTEPRRIYERLWRNGRAVEIRRARIDPFLRKKAATTAGVRRW